MRHIHIPLTLIHGLKDTMVEFKNSQILFDEYINHHPGHEISTSTNCFTGMDRTIYGLAELYQITNADHNDIDSVYVR